VVLAFLVHDALMAAPASVVAAGQPAIEHPVDSSEPHVSAPHPHGCQIGQTMVAKAPDSPLRHPIATAFVGYPAMTPPPGLRWHSTVARMRSPTAQRAELQVFRI
jgi:hypothetical protein